MGLGANEAEDMVTGGHSAQEDNIKEAQKEAIEELDEVSAMRAKHKDKPIRIAHINIEGLEKTSPVIIERELECLRDAPTFEDFLKKLQVVHVNLESLDVFKAVNITVSESQLARPGFTDVNVKLHEKSAPFFHLGVGLNGAHGEVESFAGLQNSCGRAEKISMSGHVDRGISSRSTGKATALFKFEKPRLKGTDVDLEAELGNSIIDRLKSSSFTEDQMVLAAKFKWGKAFVPNESETVNITNDFEVKFGLSKHRLTARQNATSSGLLEAIGLSLNSANQEPFATRQNPSHSIVQQMGDYLKPAIGFNWTRSIESISNPETFIRFKFNSELAGLWPDQRVVRHFRTEFRTEAVYTPFPGSPFSLAVNGTAGILRPWDTEKSSFQPSRFALGGMVTGMRGYKENSIGERAARPRGSRNGSDSLEYDYLGGDLMATGTISARWKLEAVVPAFRGSGAYAHIFGSAGQNALLHQRTVGQRFSELKSNFPQNTSYSYGLGLVMPLGGPSGLKIELGGAATKETESKWPLKFYFGIDLGQ